MDVVEICVREIAPMVSGNMPVQVRRSAKTSNSLCEEATIQIELGCEVGSKNERMFLTAPHLGVRSHD